MADPAKLPKAELEKARDLGAAMYLTAYGHLMARELGIDETDDEGIKRMMLKLIEPMNEATDAMWRSLMEDREGMDKAIHRFEDELQRLIG